MEKILKYGILITVIILTFNSCSSSVRYITKNQTEKPGISPNPNETQPIEVNNSATVLETTTGIASFYSTKFNGKTTSSGETFDMYALTAAHQTYPPGTIIRVTNLNNNLITTVKINDKLPGNSNGRIIDLSYGAAKQLDMLKIGLAKVKLEVLKWGVK